VESAYNERRAQCEAAAAAFGVKVLRDVTLARFNDCAMQLDETTLRRARHVISENERTLEAADVMTHGDAKGLGHLINASHDSLRDDFEVSNAQLDAMVEIARGVEGCLGARMTGAGFGGCAIALIWKAAAEQFMETVAAGYEKQTGLVPKLFLCEATGGAELESAGAVPAGG
jgi:galactokinase